VAYVIEGDAADTHSLMQQWLDSERLRSAGRRA
jgi:hypothetical protein